MLVAVETYFLQALGSVFPEGTVIIAGPSAGLRNNAEAAIEISAWRIVIGQEKTDDGAEKLERDSAFHLREHAFAADGTMSEFFLPEEETWEVVEVQSPPGRLLRRGDDFWVEGQTIRLFQPPVSATRAVVVRVRGERARGYIEHRSGRIEMTVRIMANERSRADELGRMAVAGLLVAGEGIGVIEEGAERMPGVRLRLLHATTAIESVCRQYDARGFHSTQIAVIVLGNLEQTVVLGEAEAQGIIREVWPILL